MATSAIGTCMNSSDLIDYYCMQIRRWDRTGTRTVWNADAADVVWGKSEQISSPEPISSSVNGTISG